MTQEESKTFLRNGTSEHDSKNFYVIFVSICFSGLWMWGFLFVGVYVFTKALALSVAESFTTYTNTAVAE